MADPLTLSAPASAPAPELSDDLGPIPIAPPILRDANGRLIPSTPEERKARASAAARAIRAMRALPDDDPPGTESEMMRGIDSHRPEGCKLFEGMY